MTTLLGVFTCRSCSAALVRHWPFFLRQQADKNIIITTDDTPCVTPPDVERVEVGSDSYIDGPRLPLRMINAITALLDWQWDVLILAEYDTLFLNKISFPQGYENAGCGIASNPAGAFRPEFSFYHNPWVFNRKCAPKFIEEGHKVIEEEICQAGSAEASPDVFFGRVCYRMEIPVQHGLWTQFTRNSLDCEGDLDRAQVAYLAGVDCIHGVKHQHELEYITR